MAESDPFLYSEGATTRIRSLRTAGVTDFVNEIPWPSLSRWLLRLPPIHGFRNNSKIAAEEQRRRLITRLISGDSKTATADWRMFRNLWLEWISAHLHRSEVRAFLLSVKNLDASGDEVISGFEEAFGKDVAGKLVSREQLQSLITFSPLAEIDRYEELLERSPTNADLAKQELLEALPDRISELEQQVKLEAQQSRARLEAEIESSLEPLAHRLNDLTQLVSDLSSRTSSLSQGNEALTTELERRVDSGRAIETRLSGLENVIGSEQKAAEQHASRLEDCLQAIATLKEAVEKVDGNPAQPESRSKQNTSEKELAELHIWNHRSDDVALRESSALTDFAELHVYLREHLKAIGLTNDSATIVALEVACGCVLNQQVSFRGSLGPLVCRAAIASCVASWDEISVPVGIFDDQTLRSWLGGKDGPSLGLMLSGVNRSAFEIYGTALRDIILSTQYITGSSVLSFASVIEGPGALPIIPEYAELGPIIDTDCLHWRTQPPNGKPDVHRVDFTAVASTVNVNVVATSRLEEESRAACELCGVIPSAVAVRTMARSATVMSSIVTESETVASEALLATWILPYLKAKGVKRKSVQEGLAGSAFAAALTSDRVRRTLASWPT